MPDALSEAVPHLIRVFGEHGFTESGVSAQLGGAAVAALYRGEPAAVLRATNGTGDPGRAELIRVFLLRRPTGFRELTDLLGTRTVELLDDAGALEHDGESGGVRISVDIRPRAIDGSDRWVFADPDPALSARPPGADHVPGVGAASLSLLQSTPTTPVDSVLDLGTGCGIQLLGQLHCAERMIGTDIHDRALDFAEATLAGTGVPVTREGRRVSRTESHNGGVTMVDLRRGPWFEPVSGLRFDRIIANPPFVISPGGGFVYRDSGLDLDAASQLVVSGAVEHLKPGGTAHLLASWVHTGESSWTQRVASWIPDTGVAAWVLQRDIADPELYVGTWLRDGSVDPRSPDGTRRTAEWLDHFAENGVTGVGFGFIALQRIDDNLPSEVTAEDFRMNDTSGLGDEVTEFFTRSAWLRGRTADEVAGSRFLVRPGLAVEDVRTTDDDARLGFRAAALRISRTEGPRFSHDIDEHLRAILSGLHPEGLSLAETVELYCAARGLDPTRVLPEATAAVVDLIRHGMVLPTDITVSDDGAHEVPR
ncbi:rRNA methyltransferase [Corynebacterium sp. CCM 9186]|uniref:DUF7782 domain-containing protein n=1 Tax=Corynebacterium meridianum TaxID=2765363 RepID=UPI0020031197|nr:rRNA methyltransferase [Corynebacterium meridianum]MCK7676697.1 rRNA methyltransferase [Corynebacterium meridianum]